MIRTLATAAAAASLAIAPLAAQAAPARIGAPASAEAEEIGGAPILLPLLVLLAAAIGIILITDGDSPTSP
jgi:hypothetical protein